MKVKHKTNGEIIDLGESWEAVEERNWTDVTEWCEWASLSGRLMHHESDNTQCWVVAGSGYRIRKVHVYDEDQGFKTVKRMAFIVEKKS